MPSSNPIDVEPLQGGLARSRALRQWSAWRAKRAEEVRHESRQLRVHAQALLERSQQLRQRYLLVVCAWCTKWRGRPRVTVSAGPVVRTCCVSWLRTQYRDLREPCLTLQQYYYLMECAWCRRRLE
jgi:hypothetical protein